MSAVLSPQEQARRARTGPAVVEWLAGGGWHVVSGTAHRGVLHPDEHVDEMRVLLACERLLGFQLCDVWEVYAQGRKGPATLALRARVDARLLEVARAGGNLTLLARVLEVERKTLHRAVARAAAA